MREAADEPPSADRQPGKRGGTANLRTKVLDFIGFDSSRILNSRGGILRSTGVFPGSLGQGILVRILLVGKDTLSSKEYLVGKYYRIV